MSQKELDRAVAEATGEEIGFIRGGFSIADPPDVRFDPEARRPFVLYWDSMSAVELSGV